ncbi:MAG TPA: hypothetical protein VEB21_13320, partial [Terriglobales bacterium]|nr:hypothetical protein [Terriglobales bacterium]
MKLLNDCSKPRLPERAAPQARRTWLLLVLALITAPRLIAADSLESRMNGLLGGLATSISPVGVGDPRSALPEGLRALPASLSTFRALAPIPSATGAFRFAWDAETATFNRMRKGPGLADTAQTLGQGFGTLSFAYTRMDFDTLEGDSLGSLRFVQPAFSSSFLGELPCDDPTDPEQCDRLRFDDDVLRTRVNIDFSLDQFVFGAAYGVTDSIDVSVALSVARADMEVRAVSMLSDLAGNSEPAFEATFASAHPCEGDPGNRQCVQ